MSINLATLHQFSIFHRDKFKLLYINIHLKSNVLVCFELKFCFTFIGHPEVQATLIPANQWEELAISQPYRRSKDLQTSHKNFLFILLVN